MATSLRRAAQARAARRGGAAPAGGRAAVIANAERQARGARQGTTAGFSFRGSGQSAAYRGAAGRVLRAGGGVIAANRAGNAANQAYAG